MAHLAALTTLLSTASPVLLAGLTAFGVTLALNPVVRAVALRFGFVGRPVAGRWSRRVVARLGGVGMFAGFAVASLLWIPLGSPVISLLLGGALVFLLGLIDDFRPLRPYTKLFCQLIIGCVMVIGGIQIELVKQPWLAIPLSVFWFVFVMNAFNLLDNMDGLAAGVGAIAAVFCAFHAVASGQWIEATMAAVICGTCLGFLSQNFPPAKMFMGDSGSNLLGLGLGTVALLGSWQHSTQLLSVLSIPVFLLAVPIFDTCFVTVQRLAHRRHPFSGGVDHVSHRLAILGLSQRRTVLVLYAVSLGFGALSVASLYAKPLTALVMWLSALSLLLVVGAYLAKVKVYDLKREPVSAPGGEASARGSTLIETMLMHKRRLVEVLVDFSLICAAYVTAHLLRFETTLSPEFQHALVQSLPIILVIKLTCFAGFGLYRGIWRYVSLPDLLTIFKAVTLSSLLSTCVLVYLWRFEGYSRTVFVIDWLLLFLMVSASRVAERLFNEWITAAAAADAQPVLIIGAGDTGELILRQIKQQAGRKRRVIGFLDDDPRKQGNRIHGCAVVGTRAGLAGLLEVTGAREVLVAIVDPPGALLRHVQECCEPRGVRWNVVTAGVTELL